MRFPMVLVSTVRMTEPGKLSMNLEADG